MDPRPTPETIHLAYENYYTHQESRGKDDYATLSPLRKLRRRMTNAYTNWRYSTNEFPALALGIPLMLLLWPQRHRLASEYRHMPQRPAGGTLLDVGCGSGSFLRTAKSCGWKVTGIDPDPKAAMACRRQGLDVLQGGIEQFAGMESLFDVITLNHVIEHVHDPVSTLAACHRLLKPNGQLWLATPNIDSLGHQQYGRNWRGLEPPRHLVLFNANSLRIVLERAGFRKTVFLSGSSPLLSMTQASEKIKRGIPIEDDLPLTAAQNLAVTKGRLRQALWARSREFLTVTAFKAERK
jgi:2-polyprenyl-3-methyl-5-hydroxy-6-metoxy-1,4-benzoquinol methylase